MTKRVSALLQYGAFVCSVGGVRVVGILITSATFPYIVRRLGLHEYGVWSYVVAICALLDILANPGLTTYASREIAAHREVSFGLVEDILALRLLAALVAVCALFGIVALEPERQIRQLFVLYGTGFLLSGVIGSDYVMNALEMFHAASALRIGQQVLYAVGVFLFLRTPKDIFWLPGSILLSTFLVNIVGWRLLAHRGLRLRLSFRPARWKTIALPSFHYAASSLMSSLYHRAGHVMVRWFLGESALGIYAAAVRLADLLRNLVTVLLHVLGPRMALSAASKDEFRRWARVATVATVVTSVPMALGLMATSRLVVPLVMGSQYAAAIPLVRWMSLYVITASAASLLAGTILYSTGRHSAYLVATGSGAVAGLLLYFVLVPTLGLLGAGISFVGAECFVGTTAYWFMRRELRGLWKNPAIGVALLAAILMLAAVRIVGSFSPSPVLVIFSGAAVYTGLCGWFFRRWFAGQMRNAT